MKNTGKTNLDAFLNAFIMLLLVAPVVVFWDNQVLEPEADRTVSCGQMTEAQGPARPPAGHRQEEKPVSRWLSALTAGTNDSPVAVWFAAREDGIDSWGT